MAGRPRKSQITVTPRAEQAKNSFVALARENPALARRLQSGNPYASGSKDIPLKEPHRWQTRIASTETDPRRFHRLKHNGWIPLAEDDLGCPVEESGFVKAPDGSLRSPDGKEMVFKMDKAHFRVLEQMKTERNMQGIGSSKKMKEQMADAAGSQLGDEAGSYINSLSGEVIDKITGGDAA